MPWWAMVIRWLCVTTLLATLSSACGSRRAESPGDLAPQLTCESSKPITVEGKETGMATCSNGMVHRPKAVTCANMLPRRGDNVAQLKTMIPQLYDLPRDKGGPSCLRDSDCTELPYGHCEPWLPPGTGASCVYGCVSDSDCSGATLCVCDSPVGHCVQASCRTDADCKAPFVCGEYVPLGGICGKSVAFACQTERDECAHSCEPAWKHCSVSEGRRVCAHDCGDI
jgi:hypothetical protein